MSLTRLSLELLPLKLLTAGISPIVAATTELALTSILASWLTARLAPHLSRHLLGLSLRRLRHAASRATLTEIGAAAAIKSRTLLLRRRLRGACLLRGRGLGARLTRRGRSAATPLMRCLRMGGTATSTAMFRAVLRGGDRRHQRRCGHQRPQNRNTHFLSPGGASEISPCYGCFGPSRLSAG